MSASAGASSSSSASAASATFDLPSYLGAYTGHTQIARALCVAEAAHPADPALSRQAFDYALRALRDRTFNVGLHTTACESAAAKFGADAYPADAAWVDATAQAAGEVFARLDADLKRYKVGAVKESIRTAHNELGAHHSKCGQHMDALKAYQKNKEYCSTREQTMDFMRRMMTCALDMGNYNQAMSQAAKLRQLGAGAAPVLAGANATMGLAELSRSNYRGAASWFLQTGLALGDAFADTVRLHDVAVYAGLCALATYERGELDTAVLRDPMFREVLALAPTVRDMISAFHQSDYGASFRFMGQLERRCKYDLHMGRHWDPLTAAIRSRVILQYFRPYVSVSLTVMAQALATSVEDLEFECARLINEGKLVARIDSQKKALLARESDKRTLTYQKVVATGDKFIKSMHSTLLGLSLSQHNFVYRPSSARDGMADSGQSKQDGGI